ncbi:recombinase RecF [Crassaminicella profunda]|uniref:recombinase RecF n=1 Tax=Crassaminicella profunda TaxID=1286698 RepID=UPI001FE5378C|nr:recombinase RecF [Crassaminicella profunda]
MIIQIKSLYLRNFKGLKNVTINFGKETDILGENATGKTTIADAFTWLLFDKDSKDRTTFDIKTLDREGQVIHGLEHEVTGVLNIDGKDIILSKIYKEKWTKKRGQAQKQMTGHETLYSIDEVPVKKKEYVEKIGSFINENIFKLITSPLYFSTKMKWEDRRKVLLEIIGDITDDRIINYKADLKPLEQLLGDKDIDIFKKSVSAKKKKLNDEIKSIPYRIDELNNSIQEQDFEALEFRKKGIVAGIKTVEDKLLDSSKVNEELLKEQQKLYDFKTKLKDMEYEAKQEALKPLKKLNDELQEIRFELNSKQNEVVYKEREIKKIEEDIQREEGQKEALRKEWFAENDKQLEFSEDEFICPTCKRPLEPNDVENKKQEMLDNFNQSKAKNLEKITTKGQEKNKVIEDLRNRLSSIDLENLKTEANELKSKSDALKSKIDNFETIVDLEKNQEYQEVLKQIKELEEKLSAPVEMNREIEELKSKKITLERELEETNGQLAYKDQNEKMKARMKELQEREKQLAQQIAEIEGQEYLCEEFVKTKVELLESSINSKFKYVSFKLFDTQVNGGLVERCEALIDGVPFSNANTAAQINAGLDIINALSDHYSVQAPIFIDNRESVNELIECNSQIVNLLVIDLSTEEKLELFEKIHPNVKKLDSLYVEVA